MAAKVFSGIISKIKKLKKGKKKKMKSSTAIINRRMLFMIGAMAVGFLIVEGVMLYYQVFNAEEYQKRAVDQQLKDITLPADRGTIYDANMETIVQSAPAWAVYVWPAEIQEDQKEAVIAKLCEVLVLDDEYVRSKVESTKQSLKLKVKADREQREKLIEFTYDEVKKETVVPGITLSVDTKRYYYRGSLAANILGFTGIDNQGLEGLELSYDSTLSGTAGRMVAAHDARNGEMPFDYQMLIDAQEGKSLKLTIDANIQTILEKYLEQAVRENNVQDKACGIIMNVNTGAIYAMATKPDYDITRPNDLSPEVLAEAATIVNDDEQAAFLKAAREAKWRNKAISDTYEPGSVFKPITMAAALEEGLTNMDDTFFCSGGLNFGSRRIGCSRSSGHGAETLTQGMMNSCNPVFMTLASRLGGSLFYKYFVAFGFTAKTGIDLPGEGVGVCHTEASLNENPADLAVSSFGQTNTVSPIQMITAFAATSNGGYLVTPHVVDQVLDSDGNIVRTVGTAVKRQIVSNGTSKLINGMLEQTVSGGTAKNGYISGYRLGGKTGTSERIAQNAATGTRTYVASYCAIAPADHPEVIMLVLLDNPQGSSHMGGTIAAPVVRNVLKEVLPYLGVETIYSQNDINYIDITTPGVVGKSVDEATEMLSKKGLSARVVGGGTTVLGQVPASSSAIPKSGTVVLLTETAEPGMATVPNVVGASPYEVNIAVKNAGLNIRYSGTGYDSAEGIAVSQDIQPDMQVAQGTVLTVEFIMGGIND